MESSLQYTIRYDPFVSTNASYSMSYYQTYNPENYVSEMLNWHEDNNVNHIVLGVFVVDTPRRAQSLYLPGGVVYLMPDVEVYPVESLKGLFPSESVSLRVPVSIHFYGVQMVYTRLGRWFTLSGYDRVVMWTS